MTGPLPDPPELEPTMLSGTNFGRARRGFEPTEVRSMLGRAADALRVWAERDAKLAERIADLSKRLDAAEEYDEARVTELLGAETARIVATARDAAAGIRGQAQEESSELLERSRTEAEAFAAELGEAATVDRAEAAKLRLDAEAAVSEMTAAATAEADRTLTEARAEADSLRESTREEAERLRESTREEVERLRAEATEAAEKLTSEAQARHDEMIEAAGKILDERTTAAELAASEVRSTAAEELENARATAANELERAREEARSILGQAETDAATRREEARAQGREMVEEARELRRQMLRDIAERARAGRQKVEAAKAARAEVIRAIKTVGGELDEAMATLMDNDQTMRRAADAAAAAVPDDIGLAVKELEDQLIAIPEDPGAQVVEPLRSVGGPATLTAISDSPGSDDGAGDFVGPADAEPTDTGVDADADADADVDADVDSADAADGSQMASVHDLFEKLRSEEPPSSEEVHPGGSGSGRVVGAEVSDQVNAPTASMGAVRVATLTEVPDTDTSDEETPGDMDTPHEVARTAARPGSGHKNGMQAILDRRDELLEQAEKLLGRALKRLLSDEQNEVLDRVRRHKRSRVEVADLLGEVDVIATFTSKLSDPYATAAAAGAKMWAELADDGSTEPGKIDIKDAPVTSALVAEALESQVDELLGLRRAQLREVLEAHSEAGADPGELVHSLRSAYRELRTSSVDELAGDLATGGFAAGTAVAAGPSAMWRWVPDNGGLPCADAEDNALEGPVACGANFPTGDERPPAHPGCRCIVVPADVEVVSDH